ncbi:MAG: galactofuranose ABC transporter, permease protein YjfF [Fimbriimonadaceae bacterium]
MKAFRRSNLPVWATLAVFVLAVTAASLRYEHFFSFDVFLNLLRDNAFLGLAAIGVTFVILSGGIDLSVGAMIGFVGVFCATLMNAGVPGWAAIALAVALGTLVGLGMGSLVAFFDLPPFLVTLAGMFLLRGMALVISMEALRIDDPLFQALGHSKWVAPGLLLAVLLLGVYLANFRPFGRAVYAVGGNEQSALLMGLPVRRTKVLVYALSGFCSSLGGVVFAFYTLSGNANSGMTLELDAIAAAVIGGTLLTGGVGHLFGTLLGVLILGTIQTVISFEGTLSSWWTRIAVGLLLLAFIGLQKLFQAGRSETP